MEWLKQLLEKAVNNDGKLDVDAAMEAVKKEFPKHAVPKSDYNDKVKELETSNTTIATLKKDNVDNDGLQKKIEDYEKDIAILKEDAEKTAKTYALKEQLSEKGCTDPEYLIYKHGGIDKFTFDKSGKPIGIDETVTPYKESIPHVFKTGGKLPHYNPVGGGNVPAVNPFAKESFNMTEQGKLLTEDPARAKELAAAAGVILPV